MKTIKCAARAPTERFFYYDAVLPPSCFFALMALVSHLWLSHQFEACFQFLTDYNEYK